MKTCGICENKFTKNISEYYFWGFLCDKCYTSVKGELMDLETVYIILIGPDSEIYCQKEKIDRSTFNPFKFEPEGGVLCEVHFRSSGESYDVPKDAIFIDNTKEN